MIAANELRLGNALEYLVEDCVDNSSEWMLNIVDTADIVDAASNESIFNKYYRPIPLTPEILEKCGFVKPSKNDNHGGLLVSIGNDVSIRLKPLISGEGYYWDNFNGAYKVIIKHLHQLQNLYWCLCRKELEINLQ